MREARACAYAHFTSNAVVQRYGVLTAAELELAARAVYDRARQQWRACAEREEEGE